MVAAASFTVNATLGLLNSYGLFFLPILSSLALSRTIASSIYSFALLGDTMGVLVGGWINDRYGPRTAGVLGSVIVSTGIVTSGLASNLFDLYISYSVLAGFGWGLVIPPSTVTVVKWFVARRGLAISIATSGSSFGTLFFPPVIQFLLLEEGWRVSFYILGLIFLPVLLMSSIMIKDVGQRASSRVRSHDAPDHGGMGSIFLGAFRNPLFMVIYLGQLLGTLCVQAYLVFVVPYAVRSGASEIAASSALVVFGIASISGRITIGPLSDKIGKLYSLALVYFLGALGALALVFAKNIVLIYATSFLVGFLLGGMIPATVSVLGDIFDAGSMGRVWGLQSSSFGLGGLAGPILVGAIFDVYGSYELGFLLTSVCCALAAALTFASRDRG